MLLAIKRFTTWITITSLVALGMGGVVAKAEVAPKGKWVARPVLTIEDPNWADESDGSVSFDVNWSTRGVLTQSTIVVLVESTGEGVQATLNSDYGAFTSPTGGSKVVAAASSGKFTVTFSIINDRVLESVEQMRISFFLGTATGTRLGSTDLTISDNETYADGFKGNTPLGATTAQQMMNAYQLAIVSNDVYAADDDEDSGTTDWQVRFFEQYSDPSYGWNDVSTYQYSDVDEDNTTIDTVDTQAVSMTNSTSIVIGFRGTQQMTVDGLTDGYVTSTIVPGTSPAVAVHTGFWEALAPVYADIKAEIKRILVADSRAGKTARTIWITGHSLGGALAQLMAYRLKMDSDTVVKAASVRVVTFGAPMVGQEQFNNASNTYSFPAKVGSAQMQRWVNLQDPVPQVPGMTGAGWRHSSQTTLLKEVDGVTKVFPGSPMPDVDLTGIEFGDHSLDLYSNRTADLAAQKLNMDVSDFNSFAPPLNGKKLADPDTTDQTVLEALQTFGYVIGGGALALTSIGMLIIAIGLTVLVAAELLMALDYVWNEIATILETAYDQTAEDAAQLMYDLGASIDDIAAALNDVYDTTVNEAVNILSAFAENARDLVSAVDAAFSDSRAAIATAMKEIGYGVQDVAEAFVAAFSGIDYSTLGGFLTSAGFGLKLIAESLVDLFATTLTQLVQMFKALGKAAADVAKAMYDAAVGTAVQIATSLKNIFLSTASAVATIFKGILVAVTDVAQVVASAFAATATVLATALKAAGYAMRQAAYAIKTILGTVIGMVADALKKAWGTLYDAIGDALKFAFATTVSAITSALQSIGATINQAASAIKAAFTVTYENLASALKTAYSATASAVASAIKLAGATLSQAAAALKSAFGAVYDTIASAVKAAYSAAASTVATAIKAIGASINQAAAALKSAFGAAYDTIAAAVKSAYSATASALASALKSISAGFSAIASAIFSLFSAGWDMLYDLLVAIGASVSEVLSILWDLF